MNERIIKFIWNYYGDPAAKTAEHHSIHLQEFAQERKLTKKQAGHQKISASHYIAYLLLVESDAEELKDILKPHQAFIQRPA